MKTIVLSLICIMVLYTYCVLKKWLKKIVRCSYCAKHKPHISVRGTLVKDSRTGEYYCR